MGISDGALEVASLGSFSIGTFQRPVQRFVSAHDLLPRLAIPGWRGQALPENRSDMTKVQPFPIPGGGTPLGYRLPVRLHLPSPDIRAD
ncbi:MULTISPECIES: hypothetical protein [unclassified Rhizobium]|uniref:hypothetical protein n=1 Tax=unclassified Rhizobium TaxID=2613769 RepID=UPI0017828214|nr:MULTISPECIES: hypothetical protein [unclassified Rhizobium]MBD8686092.1 hypothetical protein [Rhizobium sp. CFBP 13644]MBD8690235.1 hypothetical protein [Rhizobium sp. CFBP 13717]